MLSSRNLSAKIPKTHLQEVLQFACRTLNVNDQVKQMRDRFTKTLGKEVMFLPTNHWDWLALLLIFGLLIGIAWVTKQMTLPYQVGQHINISLSPSHLPAYALRTVSRLVIALILSLLFTFVFGTWAAKSRHAERFLIPIIDILQSVPVLGFQAISVGGFIALFQGNLLGPECAAIFAIFTSQAWNMVLDFYQSLSTLPHDFKEAVEMLHLSKWQRFWRVEVPHALPSLLWNIMMSMSASWFFVVASETISVANQHVTLPGIGSYIFLAIAQTNKHAIFYAIITMFLVILLYDQLIFRPLLVWAEKFKIQDANNDNNLTAWVIDLLQKTQLMRYIGHLLDLCSETFVNAKIFNAYHKKKSHHAHTRINRFLLMAWYSLFFAAIIISAYLLFEFIFIELSWYEIMHVAVLGLITATRIIILIAACSCVWVPIGVWVGLHPKITNIVKPIAQFLAAFPANLLFPFVVMLIVKFQLNVEIWTTPLMILGTQWYILFNVIAGTTALPKDLIYVAQNFRLRKLLKWRRLILPNIFPYYITGAITAAGGAWNASIIAEVVTWGKTQLIATGIGAYITQNTIAGDYPRIALGITIMCLYVLVLNHIVWRPLYTIAHSRFNIDSAVT